METFFEACDENNRGYLGREEFKVTVLMLFGYKPSKVKVDSVMSSMDCLCSMDLYPWHASAIALEKSMFLFSAKNHEMADRRFLTFENFKKALSSASPKLSERIIVEAFREVNQNSDGHISFKEFESAMKYGRDEISPLYFA
ncbi:EF-hand calcium-binding domain-containing protein 11 [Grus americana]|uniref:EF-hand calcium-binding domain-containing protein 11 n=1 Tax=Grus americana TaxID=9117 RepID=UPI002407ECCB|nr:EF-hand calcium-binding domain-containing protein 11 [Grus americana]